MGKRLKKGDVCEILHSDRVAAESLGWVIGRQCTLVKFIGHVDGAEFHNYWLLDIHDSDEKNIVGDESILRKIDDGYDGLEKTMWEVCPWQPRRMREREDAEGGETVETARETSVAAAIVSGRLDRRAARSGEYHRRRAGG